MIDSYALLNKRLYLGASIHTALRSLSKFFCPFGGKPSLPFSFLHSTAYAITMVCTLCNICFSAHSKFKSQFSCSNKWPMKHTQISLQRKKHTGALCHRRPVLSTTHLSFICVGDVPLLFPFPIPCFDHIFLADTGPGSTM